MPELEKEKLSNAVSFASSLMKKGHHRMPSAIRLAGEFYNVPTSEISKEIKTKEENKNDSNVSNGSNV